MFHKVLDSILSVLCSLRPLSFVFCLLYCVCICCYSIGQPTTKPSDWLKRTFSKWPTIGCRTFSVACPTAWNSLTDFILDPSSSRPTDIVSSVFSKGTCSVRVILVNPALCGFLTMARYINLLAQSRRVWRQWCSQKFSTGGASICSIPFCLFPFSFPTKSAVQSENVMTYSITPPEWLNERW